MNIVAILEDCPHNKHHRLCHNLNFGITTKARACKGASQERSLGVKLHAPRSAKEHEGVNPHTPKWIPILGVGIPNGLWFSIIKSRESPQIPGVQVACNIKLRSFWKRLKIYFKHLNQRFVEKNMGPKITGVPTLGISRLPLPLGSLGTKCHLDASPMASHRVYSKGEGGGFP